MHAKISVAFSLNFYPLIAAAACWNGGEGRKDRLSCNAKKEFKLTRRRRRRRRRLGIHVRYRVRGVIYMQRAAILLAFLAEPLWQIIRVLARDGMGLDGP